MHQQAALSLAILGLGAVTIACGSPTSANAGSAPKTNPIARYTPASSKDIAKYRAVVAKVERQRTVLAQKLLSATTGAQRDYVLKQARRLLERSIVRGLAPAWVGTPWEFSGTSQDPRTGTIACGYFVSTLLRDSGLRVERVKMAQQASERIIKSLTSGTHIRRFSDAKLPHFLKKVRAQGRGLYVVGLDYHVGFLWVGPKESRFIHSSNVGCPTRAKGCVVDESADTSLALEHSRYRVVGRISVDTSLLRRWLRGKAMPII